jgi:ribosome-associated protein
MPIGRIPVGSRQRDLIRSRLASRVTADDCLRVTARRERHQARNRTRAIDRMAELISEAIAEDPRRRATRPGTGVQRRRRAERDRLSRKKSERRRPPDAD